MLFPSVSRLAGARPAFGSAKRFAFLQLFFRPGNHRARQDRTWPDETVDRLPSSPKVSTALCAPWVVECGALRHCPPPDKVGRSPSAPRQRTALVVARVFLPPATNVDHAPRPTVKNALPPLFPSRQGLDEDRTRVLSVGIAPFAEAGGPRRTPDFTRVARGLPGPLPLPFAGMLSLSGNCRPMSGLRAVCRESSGR